MAALFESVGLTVTESVSECGVRFQIVKSDVRVELRLTSRNQWTKSTVLLQAQRQVLRKTLRTILPGNAELRKSAISAKMLWMHNSHISRISVHSRRTRLLVTCICFHPLSQRCWPLKNSELTAEVA